MVRELITESILCRDGRRKEEEGKQKTEYRSQKKRSYPVIFGMFTETNFTPESVAGKHSEF
jgi:hypothetical protein